MLPHLSRCLAFLLLAPAALAAGGERPEPGALRARVDVFVRAEMEKRRVPGVSVAVIRDGRTLFTAGYGLAVVDPPQPAEPGTVYQIASVTKTFTAACAMVLVQDGRLTLDDPLSKHLPDMPAAWGAVTVRQLLNHTSGIKSYTSIPSFHRDPERDYTAAELLALVRDAPADFKPGERWAYNNTGYYLLGLLAEKVAAQPFAEFLGTRILRPLEMSATRMNERGALPRRAKGYRREGEKAVPAPFVSPTQPFTAGAMVSTVEDLAKWDLALYTDTPLKAATRELMWQPTPLAGGGTAGYGLGWGVGETNEHRTIEHGGGILGFSSQILRFPERKLSVVVLTNLEGGHAGALARGIAGVCDPALAPPPSEGIPDPDTSVTDRLRKLLVALADQKADPEDFAPDLRKRLFPARAPEISAALKGLGSLERLVLLRTRTEQGALRRRYRVHYTRRTAFVDLGLDADGKVDLLMLSPDPG